MPAPNWDLDRVDQKAQIGYPVLFGAFDQSEVLELVLTAPCAFLSLRMLSPSTFGGTARYPSCPLGNDTAAMERSSRNEIDVECGMVFEKWSRFERGVASLLSVNVKLENQMNDWQLGTVARRISRHYFPFLPFFKKGRIDGVNIQSTASTQ